MIIPEIRSHLDALEQNTSLHEEKNFEHRTTAIDVLGFQVIDLIDTLLPATDQGSELLLLRSRAEQLKSVLEEIDRQLFQRLRESIRDGATGEAFKSLVHEYIDFEIGEYGEETNYDNLDLFINGLSLFHTMPEQTRDLEPEMVYYQKTPARVVFELVGLAHFTKEDVFFDLGSGLGQVAILVNLLTGITVKGIEFEPAFCRYAKDCAAELHLTNVTFLNVDARYADYSEGTVFFMFTPFGGEILQEVLEKLRKESLLRKITIITYGPCTARVALESWLAFVNPADHKPYRLGVFRSCPTLRDS